MAGPHGPRSLLHPRCDHAARRRRIPTTLMAKHAMISRATLARVGEGILRCHSASTRHAVPDMLKAPALTW